MKLKRDYGNRMPVYVQKGYNYWVSSFVPNVSSLEHFRGLEDHTLEFQPSRDQGTKIVS